jgi:hypothetical protein
MTITGRDVSDELFARLRAHFSDDEIIDLTEIIAWENASAKFNRALRIPSQQLWKRTAPPTRREDEEREETHEPRSDHHG